MQIVTTDVMLGTICKPDIINQFPLYGVICR